MSHRLSSVSQNRGRPCQNIAVVLPANISSPKTSDKCMANQASLFSGFARADVPPSGSVAKSNRACVCSGLEPPLSEPLFHKEPERPETKLTLRRVLLLTVLGSRVSLDDEAQLPFFYLLASILYELCEAAGQFSNAISLPPLNGLGWNQFCAHSDRCGSGQNIVAGGLLVYASGCDQSYLGQGGVERLDVLVSVERSAGEDLDEIAAGTPSRHDFGRRQCSWKNRHVLLCGKFDNRRIERWGREEACSCVDTLPSSLSIEHGTRANRDFCLRTAKVGDQLHRSRNGHGDFYDRDSAMRNGLCREMSVVSRPDSDGGYDADFPDESADIIFFHSQESFVQHGFHRLRRLLNGFVYVDSRKLVVVACKPCIKRRHQNHTDDQVGN